MKVQNKLSITNTIVFTFIFTLMMAGIVFAYYQSSKHSIYSSLKKTSYITALFHLEEDELSEKEFEKVKEQFDYEAFNQAYQFYNDRDSIEFGETRYEVPTNILQEIRSKEFLAFDYDDFLCYGIYYEDNQGDFVIVSKEHKSSLNKQIYNLTVSMFLIWLLGVGITILVNIKIARGAYRPFLQVINEVKDLDISKEKLQINTLNSKDELSLLIDTFNDLLSRLSETFEIQRNFVKYVSHEFKTPLTSMMGNLDVFLLKPRTEDEYKILAGNLIREIQYLEETLNTLIFLTNTSTQSKNIRTETSIDELVWISIDKLNKKYPNLKINTHFPDIESSLLIANVNPNEVLVAITNILDNAVKYSTEQPVDIYFANCDGLLKLTIQDHGIGMEEKELNNIFKPFYRSPDVKNIVGSGLGLTLSNLLFQKNGINMEVISQKNIGTTVALIFT